MKHRRGARDWNMRSSYTKLALHTVFLKQFSHTIIIKINELDFKIKIDATQLADLVWNKLPIEASVSLWGDEIYFQTDIESQTSDLQQIVEIGDVAFWPPGQAICLFFGQTPMSTPNEIRPASEVAVFGKFIDDPKMLKVVKSGEFISLIKA